MNYFKENKKFQKKMGMVRNIWGKWVIIIWRRIFKWKKNGNGKEYDYNGELVFEGLYLNWKEMEKEKNILLVY